MVKKKFLKIIIIIIHQFMTLDFIIFMKQIINLLFINILSYKNNKFISKNQYYKCKYTIIYFNMKNCYEKDCFNFKAKM
jgi:hypothetical protein